MKSILPYPELHEMTFTPKTYTWTCPECGRKVQVEPFKIIAKGNQDAVHQGSVGGLMMSVTIKPKDP